MGELRYDDAGSGAKRKGAALEDSFLDRLTRLHSSMNSKLNSYAAANGGRGERPLAAERSC